MKEQEITLPAFEALESRVLMDGNPTSIVAPAPEVGSAYLAPVTPGCEVCKPADFLCSTRYRTETTFKDGEAQELLTFGLADCDKGKHGDEYFRLYQYLGSPSYTAMAFKFPEIKIGELSNKVALFGTLGDREGIGIQTTHTFKNLTGVFNLEKNLTDDSSRIGFGLDHRLGKWTLGGAFDTLNTRNGRTNQYLAHAIYDVSDKDQLGFAYVLSDFEGDLTNSLGAFWCHMNDSWGTRARIEHKWGEDKSALGFDVIVAQKPKFSKYSSPWILGRDADSTMYNLPAVQYALASERVALGDRSGGGFFGEVQGNFDFNESQCSWVRGDIGHRFQQDSWDVSPSVFYKHNFSGGDCTGASVLLHPKKIFGGNLGIEATYTHPIDGGKDSVYVGVQFSCPIGGTGRH